MHTQQRCTHIVDLYLLCQARKPLEDDDPNPLPSKKRKLSLSRKGKGRFANVSQHQLTVMSKPQVPKNRDVRGMESVNHKPQGLYQTSK